MTEFTEGGKIYTLTTFRRIVSQYIIQVLASVCSFLCTYKKFSV